MRMSRMPCYSIKCAGADQVFSGRACSSCGEFVAVSPVVEFKHGRTPRGVQMYASDQQRRDAKNERRRARRAQGFNA